MTYRFLFSWGALFLLVSSFSQGNCGKLPKNLPQNLEWIPDPTDYKRGRLRETTLGAYFEASATDETFDDTNWQLHQCIKLDEGENKGTIYNDVVTFYKITEEKTYRLTQEAIASLCEKEIFEFSPTPSVNSIEKVGTRPDNKQVALTIYQWDFAGHQINLTKNAQGKYSFDSIAYEENNNDPQLIQQIKTPVEAFWNRLKSSFCINQVIHQITSHTGMGRWENQEPISLSDINVLEEGKKIGIDKIKIPINYHVTGTLGILYECFKEELKGNGIEGEVQHSVRRGSQKIEFDCFPPIKGIKNLRFVENFILDGSHPTGAWQQFYQLVRNFIWNGFEDPRHTNTRSWQQFTTHMRESTGCKQCPMAPLNYMRQQIGL